MAAILKVRRPVRNNNTGASGYKLLDGLLALILVCVLVYNNKADNQQTVSRHFDSSGRNLVAGISCQSDIIDTKETVLFLLYHQPARQIASCRQPSLTRLIVLHLLLLSGDLELNPGPKDQGIIEYPCGKCGAEVTWEANAIFCDGCEHWLHTECINMSLGQYHSLAGHTTSWICGDCGMMNISTSLFNSGPVHTSNSYHPLSDATSDTADSITFDPTTSPGAPMHTSSPHSRNITRRCPSPRVLTVLNVNCQSIIAKRGLFEHMIDSVKPDIVVGTESWLSPQIASSECLPTDDYHVERRDRQGDPHGGVFILAKKDLIMSRATELETDCELLWCKIDLCGSKTLYVGAYYRPHEGDELSLQQLETSLGRMESDKEVILAGDLNFPGWDWKNKVVKQCHYPTLHHKLGEMLDDRGLEQLVTEPTRGENILDLVITTNPTRCMKTTVIPGVSDHDIVLTEYDTRPIRHKQFRRQIPLYKKADWDSIRQHLENTYNIMRDRAENMSTQDLWTMFKEALLQGVKDHIPHRHTKGKDQLPWITVQIRRMMKKRDRLWRQYRDKKDVRYLERSKDMKAVIQREMRKAYWTYVDSIITPDTEGGEYNSMKRFWTFIKHRRKDNTGVASLKDNGKLTSDPKEKADILNKQFESVFTRDHSTDTERETSQYPTMADIAISEQGVLKLLQGLKIHKAPGPDGISPRVLKELSTTIAPMLTLIFQKSYDTGEVPTDWREANVAPIYKKGNKSEAVNYRPVSLTCIACKLLEHIVTSSIMQHAKQYDILYHLQHGFREKRSCETQLLEFVTDLSNNMQSGKQTDVLIMDFSKAFDKVSHTRLVSKLERYGIQGRTNNWIKAFLQDRHQQVVVEGQRSYSAHVRSGVPQGSVLGPSLFLFYINDLPTNLTSTVRLFADDTVAYLTIRSDRDHDKLQSDLDKLAQWEAKWKMEFHPKKCQVMHITRQRKPRISPYTLHGHVLERVDEAKYLGVTVTSDLRWKSHVQNVANKASRSLGFLRRNLRTSSQALKTTAYFTLVRPHLEYACTVWDPYTQQDIKQIEAVQRRAARYVLNRNHATSSVGAMLEQLGWPTLQQRRKQSRLQMMYKITNDLVAIKKDSYMKPITRQTRRTTSSQGYIIPHSSADYHLFSFFPRTLREWMDLPPDVASAPSLEAFKERVAKAAF